MFDKNTVATIIISYNTRALLLESLASVAATFADDPRSEVVVVDNASEDGCFGAVRESFPQVRAIRNERNLGFGAACNQGVKATAAPMLLLLNSDARINPEAVTAMLDCMGDPRCAIAGCSIVDGAGTPAANTRNFLSSTNQALELLGIPVGNALGRSYRPRLDANLRDCSVDWIDGACLLIRRAAFEEAGGFDERFFMYSEDEDLCLRIRKAGWSVCLTASASALHHGAASSRQRPFEMLVEFYSSQLMFLARHRGRLAVLAHRFLMRRVLWLKATWGPRAGRALNRERRTAFRFACMARVAARERQ